MIWLAWIMMCLPLCGAMLACLGYVWGHRFAHRASIGAMLLAFVLSSYLVFQYIYMGVPATYGIIYAWLSDVFSVGVCLDPLSVIMCWCVCCVSLLVHIYSITYMAKDTGYPRFFAAVSFFTFAMLMLVCAPNLLQLFFGWEGVGVASYLLIGYWFTKPAAADGALKAFLVNRVADCGFFIAIATLYAVYGHLDIVRMWQDQSPLYQLVSVGGLSIPAIQIAAWGLLFGAMGKSAQMPLHLWLPESMAGPTPISALIHAATMVTAGVYLMCRMSFVMNGVPAAGHIMCWIGLIGACLLGVMAIVQDDIKRVIAYSTLSQLGLMMSACGAGLYPLAMCHLLTHAGFKALLFLAAGSYICAMHHEQDLRRLTGVGRSMPLTSVCMIIGALSLVAMPGFSGFYSKDLLIEGFRGLYGATALTSYMWVLAAWISAAYVFRVVGIVCVAKGSRRAQESDWRIGLPLVVLAFISLFAGMWIAPWIIQKGALGPWVDTLAQVQNVMTQLQDDLPWGIYTHALSSVVFWGTVAVSLWQCYKPHWLSDRLVSWCPGVWRLGYGFEALYRCICTAWQRLAGWCGLFDSCLLDGAVVMGLAKNTGRLSHWLSARIQIHLYQHLFMMLLGVGVLAVLVWWYG